MFNFVVVRLKCTQNKGYNFVPPMSLSERWWLLFTLPLCPTDEKVQISIVLDDQLVIIVAYSVTNKSSFSVN